MSGDTQPREPRRRRVKAWRARQTARLTRAGKGVLRGAAWLAGQLDLRDLCAFGGIALMGYGLRLVYLPAGYIVPGLALLFLATWRR